ncbi:MAG: hypothetical protein ACI8RZ_001171 [Myxococcota bacterium]|jgi:hypothetical protein
MERAPTPSRSETSTTTSGVVDDLRIGPEEISRVGFTDFGCSRATDRVTA